MNLYNFLFLLKKNSKELEAAKAKNEELLQAQANARHRNSEMDRVENQLSLRNKNVEKHMTDLDDNIKNLNNLLYQERSKVIKLKYQIKQFSQKSNRG